MNTLKPTRRTMRLDTFLLFALLGTIIALRLNALLQAQSPPPQGSLKTIHDARTGTIVDSAIADGTVYRFEANMAKVHFWQVPVPLDGVWLESADSKSLTWISSSSGAIATSADPCPAGVGGGAGDCPTNNPTCNGISYDPTTELCCGGQVYNQADGCCVNGTWYANGAVVATCSNCVNSVVVDDPTCPRCDNAHTLSPPSLYECDHFSDDTNGTPCSTTRVIENTLLSATCDHHPNRTGAANCNVTPNPPAVEVVQVITTATCPGGNVNWAPWITIYSGCETGCGGFTYSNSCVTEAISGSFVRQRNVGTSKKVGCP